jgi:hypothetical protein
VGLRNWLRERGTGPGSVPVHVDEPAYDSWEPLRDFADLETARAFHQELREAGFECVLTSDWPLDEFGHGDIALRVPRGRWGDAEAHLDNLDLD